MIRVLVADDDGHFLRGLACVLGWERDIEIVGTAHDGAAAVAKSLELMPDVVTVDMHMPRVDGVEAVRAIHDALPQTAVVVLTISDDDNHAYKAMQAGAAAYLLKDISLANIAEAIRAVANGQCVLAPSMAAKLLDEVQQLDGVSLSETERQVLTMLAAGASTTEIARDLWGPEQAVRTHVRNVLGKVHLHTRRARQLADLL